MPFILYVNVFELVLNARESVTQCESLWQWHHKSIKSFLLCQIHRSHQFESTDNIQRHNPNIWQIHISKLQAHLKRCANLFFFFYFSAANGAQIVKSWIFIISSVANSQKRDNSHLLSHEEKYNNFIKRSSIYVHTLSLVKHIQQIDLSKLKGPLAEWWT